MEKKLIKIIYKNYYLEPISIDFQKDIEVITGCKSLKKKRKNKIKYFFKNIKNIEGDYSNLNKKPRDLLKISDNISKMKDENFLGVGKNIKNAYLKISDEKKYMKTIEDKNNQNLRNRILKNIYCINKKIYNIKQHIRNNNKNKEENNLHLNI